MKPLKFEDLGIKDPFKINKIIQGFLSIVTIASLVALGLYLCSFITDWLSESWNYWAVTFLYFATITLGSLAVIFRKEIAEEQSIKPDIKFEAGSSTSYKDSITIRLDAKDGTWHLLDD